MVDVLTWTIERRVQLAERAERLRKELAEIDAEVARLEAHLRQPRHGLRHLQVQPGTLRSASLFCMGSVSK